MIITFEEAKARGLKTYFTGKPCKHGHVAVRFTANRTCAECNAAKQKQWAAANVTAVRDANREWKAHNPEQVREIDRKKYVRNREKKLLYAKRYRESNKERVAEAISKWFANNPAKARAIQARRRAREIQATPAWLTPEHLAAIAEVYSEAQRLTEETGIMHHVDHIVPLQGKLVCGLHVPWNLQPLPANDNIRKSNRFDVA